MIRAVYHWRYQLVQGHYTCTVHATLYDLKPACKYWLSYGERFTVFLRIILLLYGYMIDVVNY